MNLGHPPLIEKFGTWVKVMIAFYDFVWQKAAEAKPELAQRAADQTSPLALDDFAFGSPFFEQSVLSAAEVFPTMDDAWSAFLKAELGE